MAVSLDSPGLKPTSRVTIVLLEVDLRAAESAKCGPEAPDEAVKRIVTRVKER